MNDHYVYDGTSDHEAKGHRMATASSIVDFKPTADDPENVRCRLTVQQQSDFVRDGTHQGTPLLWTLRLLLSLAVSKPPRDNR